jgi:CHAD domain-containing protein
MEDNRTARVWALQTVRRLWADFMIREPGTLRGEDPEQLHRMRVAHRRLRTAISSLADVLPGQLVTAGPELKWIGGELGLVRDLDVQMESMREAAGRLDASPESIDALLAAVDDQREQARQRMLHSLTSSRFERLVLQVARTLREQAVAPGTIGEPTISKRAPRVLEERYRKFRKAARNVTPKSSPQELHKARRRARKLRFATEFVEELYGEPAEDLIDAATELQDLFGEHQDCYAAIELRRRVLKSLPKLASELAHELDEHDREHAASLRKSAPSVVKHVKKRWKSLQKAMES